MRNLIIKLCLWVIDRLMRNDWVTVKMNEDGTFESTDKKGRVYYSKTGHKWTPKLMGILILLNMFFGGCSTHKHCGTVHYSEMTSQDFENIKQRAEVNEFLLRQ